PLSLHTTTRSAATNIVMLKTNASTQPSTPCLHDALPTFTYTATDTTDSITISQTATVNFTVGPISASTATVSANPTSVTADGSRMAENTAELHHHGSHQASGNADTLTAGSGSRPNATVNE